MNLLAISGSARRLSTNTALLKAMQAIAPEDVRIEVFDDVGSLPIFSPDLEGSSTPERVRQFKQLISHSDGIIISSPEYIHSIPGGLKNAIDWLVSGSEIVGKPMALVHASHRGDDMLAALRKILSTISSNFTEKLFYRLPLMNEKPESVHEILNIPINRVGIETFLRDFTAFCRDRERD